MDIIDNDFKGESAAEDNTENTKNVETAVSENDSDVVRSNEGKDVVQTEAATENEKKTGAEADGASEVSAEKQKISFGKAYGRFAVIFVSLFAFIIATGLAQIVVPNIIKEYDPQFIKPDWFESALSVATMYLVGLPVAAIILLFLTKEPEIAKKRISFGKWLKLFCIASAMMYAGSLLSNIINSALSFLPGTNVHNIVEEIMSGPIWASALSSVVLAPVLEELLFRKLIIDRIRGYGEKFAIFISALSFGLLHGNFEQFFYTFAIGLLFGYVYTKTGKLWYTISLHAAINFMFGVVNMLVANGTDGLREALLGVMNGEVAAEEFIGGISAYIVPILLALLNSLAVAAIVICGIIFFITGIRKGLTFKGSRFELEKGKLSVAAVWSNVGFWLFALYTILAFASSIFIV